MKKFIFILIAVMLAVAVNAQEKHLKFMGIPLNLTITQFQNKLIAKGFKPDSFSNKQIQSNCRIFNGLFCGYESVVFVYYIPSSKIVYRAKACIIDSDENFILKKYSEIKGMISEKYGSIYMYDDKNNGYDSTSWAIINTNPVGSISMYVSVFDDMYPTTYTLQIDYEDLLNTKKQKQKLSEDL